jgi:aminoglycoside phosphotransferase (APT) family kinase protein
MNGVVSRPDRSTTDVRDVFEFDAAALTRWMEAHVEGYRSPLTVEQFEGGQSSQTDLTSAQPIKCRD